MAINKRIRKDGSVGWQVVVDEYDAVTKKRGRHVVGTFPDHKTAKLQHAKAIADISESKFVKRSSYTVKDVVELWIDAKRRSIRATSISQYEIMAKNYITPALGDVLAQALTPVMVQRVVNEWTRDGSHYATANSCMAVLSSAFNHALRMRIVQANPCTGVIIPRNPIPKERTIWTEEEVGRFTVAAGQHDLAALWLLLLETGMRRGEALGLHWSDIDWSQSAVRIASTAVQDRRTSKMHIQPIGKTDSSRRVVLISAALLSRLREWRKSHTDSVLVFPGKDNGPMRGNWLRDELGRLCNTAKVRVVTVHELRHISATRMMRAGIPLVVAQQRMGHSSSEMLRKVYQHADADLQRDAVAALERLTALSDTLSTGTDTGE